MIAVIGGLIAALAWGLATLAAARASRVIGPWSATGWVVLIGLIVTVPLLLLEAPAETMSTVQTVDIAWLGIAGLGYVTGLLLSYAALAGGKIPITSPIVSTEGAIAATLAVLAGESASPLLALMLGLIAAGVFVAVLKPGGGFDSVAGDGARYVSLAIIAALVFGIGLFAAGQASASLPPSWVVAAGRIAGVALLTVPLLLTRRLHLDRGVLPLVLFAGTAEVVGVYAFAWGAQESIAVTAVLGSQFAVIAAVIASTMGERISPRQWVGVAAVVVGVTVITVSRL